MVTLPLALFLIASMFASVSLSESAESEPCLMATPIAATPAAVEAVRIAIDGDEALLWPAGERAVLLVHGAIYDAASWSDQADVFAEHGYTVLSLERISSDAVLAGIAYLQQSCDITGITVIGASAGVGGSISAVAETESGIDGLIVLAGSGDVAQLGDYPKLFVASEGEGIADTMTRLAEEAPGDHNSVLLLAGSAHAQAVFLSEEGEELLQEILDFLEMKRR